MHVHIVTEVWEQEKGGLDMHKWPYGGVIRSIHLIRGEDLQKVGNLMRGVHLQLEVIPLIKGLTSNYRYHFCSEVSICDLGSHLQM